jgi:beta-galactosidase/beta-glucuronidase
MNKSTLISLALLSCVSVSAQRTTQNLRQWQFSRDSISYKAVTIPHDWAINGPFDKKWDLQNVAIVQNGETEKTEKSGRSGALPWIGRGYYKTTIDIKRLPKTAVLEFDGAMADPHVYINGKLAGHWAYGYNAFRVDAAPYLKKGKNEISVSLNNREESSRWYPGGGLYRPVQLVTTADRASINPWGSYFRTELIKDGKAEVSVCTNINNAEKRLVVENLLIDNEGKTVAQTKTTSDVEKRLTVENAQLWSPESPYLYRFVTRLYRNNKLVDETTEKVGIRTVRVAQYDGFQLNGKSRKIKGVCLHHDLGPLGAAVNKAALIRQIRTMKDMGCDTIRTAHNMPSTWQMEVCDSMGMMVMAESFDMWIYPKCKNGETEKTEKSGRSGALPWIGRGYYKTTIDIKRLPKTAVLEFDGAMADPHVYINGKLAGHWAYGYNAFRVDAAPYLKKGKNEISVSLNNREESSRWYPGGGLYRPVQLVTTADRASINPWGSYFRTELIKDGKAEVSVCTNINNAEKRLVVENLLIDNEGKTVAQTKTTSDVEKRLTVENAQLWSPESPYLYRFVTRLYRNNKLVDETTEKVGIRTVRVAQYDGFQLNGKSRKIKGVCLHHDLGPLGAAVNKAALIRQIRTMKDMGCDAIRTAHNMPSTWQMEVCDSMGMMVICSCC